MGERGKDGLRVAMIGLRGIPHTYGGGEEFGPEWTKDIPWKRSA